MLRLTCALVLLTLLVADRPLAVAESTAAETGTAAPPAMNSAALIALADSVQSEVEMLRGWTFKHPVAKDVRSPEQLHAFLKESLDREYPDDRFEHVQSFLRTVGLLPEPVGLESTLVSILLNQVAGFYDPATRGFYMVNLDGMHMPPAMLRILIAHELTHALDDQYVSLDSLLFAVEPTEDAQFAVAAVAEGSAMELMTRYLARMQMTGALPAEELSALMRSEMERSRPFLESPPYFASIVGRYTCGMWFLLRNDMTALMNVNGDSGVGKVLPQVWARLPRSSEQILHREKYWDEASRDEPVVVDDESVRIVLAAAGARVLHTNTVGEALCAVLTRTAADGFSVMTAASASAWTNTAASGWGGDRFYLLGAAGADGSSAGATQSGFARRPQSDGPRSGGPVGEDDGRHAMRRARGMWITTWDTPTDRDEFVAAYTPVAEARGAVAVIVGERSAVYVYGFGGGAAGSRDAGGVAGSRAAGRAAVDAIIADLKAAPSPLSQAGQPVAW